MVEIAHELVERFLERERLQLRVDGQVPLQPHLERRSGQVGRADDELAFAVHVVEQISFRVKRRSAAPP